MLDSKSLLMTNGVTPRGVGQVRGPGTCVLNLVILTGEEDRGVPDSMKPGQFVCCLCTRNCGCQLPLETFSTRTSTRSSSLRLPSPMSHILLRSVAPSALDPLLPLYIVCVSPCSRNMIPPGTWWATPEAEQMLTQFWRLRRPASPCLSIVVHFENRGS